MIKYIILFYLLIHSNLFASQNTNNVLTLGVVPQHSYNKLVKIWKPIIDEIEKNTNYKIVLKIEKSIPHFEKKLYSGKYDIAYSNPYHYVLANKKQNHQAILRFKKNIQGILVKNKGSNIKDIKDIKKETSFFFPAPKAFAATILTKYELLLKGINIEKNNNFKYVNSHDSVYIGTSKGISDIGGGIMRTYNKSEVKNDLEILYRTKKYPSHPISINGDLPKNVINKIEKSFMSIDKKLLNKIKPGGLIKTSNQEYNEVLKLAKTLEIY